MAVFPNSIPLPENRAALEHLIEAAIARLDQMDGDPDLEDADFGEDGGDAEPWLGSAETGPWAATWSRGVHDDREADDGDLEPSLGAIERGEGSQVMWAAGGSGDLERSGEARMWIPGAAPEAPMIAASACVRRAV